MEQILPHLFNKAKIRFDENFSDEKMSNLLSANLDFEKHDRRFTAGESLNGILSVDCPPDVDVISIFISLRGETNVSWHEMLIKHSANLTELKIKEDFTHFFQKIHRGSTEKITKIPFKFDLPPDLPSSIESHYGFTRYDCVVEIECRRHSSESKKSVTDTFEFPFTVLAKSSENAAHVVHGTQPPIRCENKIELGSYTGPPEEIVIRLSIPKIIYACGETIDTLMHVENKTYYHTIHEIGVALVQNIHASVGSHEKIETKTIAAQKVGPNLQHGKSEEIAATLQVPQDLLPTQSGQMISIRYQVEVIGDEDHLKSKTWIPITIVGSS